MTRTPRDRRRASLGFSMRFAVAVLWPFMRVAVKWDVQGADRLTAIPGGTIAAPNHNSWFDPLVIAFVLWEADRPPRFLAKHSVFGIPVIGRIIAHAGQIPVYREGPDPASAIRDALTALDRGECVVVYPEGTMTRDPDQWPMSGKTGAVRLALTSGCPLLPIAQWGANEVMPPYVKAFRLLPRKTMHVVVGEPVDLDDLRGRPLDAATLTLGTERLMDAITGLLAGIRQETAPTERMSFDRFPKRSEDR